MRLVHPPISLPDQAATEALGRALAGCVRGGDTLLLEGGLGAGKTHLARALIQSLLPVHEDVPSPSFTLVQTYAAPDFDIWHADLFRLSGLGDLNELGLEEAFSHALCLIEWPDRMPRLPEGALQLWLMPEGAGRRVELTSTDPAWAARLVGLWDVLA